MTTVAAIEANLGKRVLVSVYDQVPLMTTVRAISPHGQYVWLSSQIPGYDLEVGWRQISRVQILEVLGSSDDTIEDVTAKVLARRAEVVAQQLAASASLEVAPVDPPAPTPPSSA